MCGCACSNHDETALQLCLSLPLYTDLERADLESPHKKKAELFFYIKEVRLFYTITNVPPPKKKTENNPQRGKGTDSKLMAASSAQTIIPCENKKKKRRKVTTTARSLRAVPVHSREIIKKPLKYTCRGLAKKSDEETSPTYDHIPGTSMLYKVPLWDGCGWLAIPRVCAASRKIVGKSLKPTVAWGSAAFFATPRRVSPPARSGDSVPHRKRKAAAAVVGGFVLGAGHSHKQGTARRELKTKTTAGRGGGGGIPCSGLSPLARVTPCLTDKITLSRRFSDRSVGYSSSAD